MKKLYLFIICAAILFLMPSCKKEEEMPAYTITGTLKENCGSLPLAGAYLELFQDVPPGGMSKSQTLHTNTDNNGHFSFTYKDNTSIPLSLFYGTASSSSKILMGIPAEKNIDLGDVYTNNKSYLYIKINYDNSHSASDTLYYAILPSSAPRTFAGPFPVTFIDSVRISKGHFAGDNSYNGTNEEGRLIWGLGYNDYKQSLNSIIPETPDYHVEHFIYRSCGYKDTAFIKVL
ncbi:MAG: hypothetical protein K0S44_1587 [Bacteroidetes bacterium]|jgi:hypothetical protein|nr:hypothetical protein [Bacteroidota bacterium]